MPAQNKVVYNKELGLTYIMSPDGKTQIGHLEGDHSKDPIAYTFGQQGDRFQPQSDETPYTPSSFPDKAKQMAKDFVVNVASQAPMAFSPEMGVPGRAIGSLLAGFGLDQMLNPDRPAEQSAGQAGANTAISSLAELLPNVRMSGPPLLSKNAPGSKGALFGKFGLLSNLLPRFSLETDPLAAAPETLSQKLSNVPPAATRGPKGQFLKQADIQAALKAFQEQRKQVVMDDVMKRLKNNAAGLISNEAFDATVNRPQ
jgi:hypothetical protein